MSMSLSNYILTYTTVMATIFSPYLTDGPLNKIGGGNGGAGSQSGGIVIVGRLPFLVGVVGDL